MPSEPCSLINSRVLFCSSEALAGVVLRRYVYVYIYIYTNDTRAGDVAININVQLQEGTPHLEHCCSRSVCATASYSPKGWGISTRLQAYFRKIPRISWRKKKRCVVWCSSLIFVGSSKQNTFLQQTLGHYNVNVQRHIQCSKSSCSKCGFLLMF